MSRRDDRTRWLAKTTALIAATASVLAWPMETAGQKPTKEPCVDGAPYKPRPAHSGRMPNLPTVPTLPAKVLKQGTAFTVFGALRALRDPEGSAALHDKDIVMVGKAAADPDDKLASCLKRPAWPKGEQACHLWLVGGASEHVTVIVTGATKTTSAVPAAGGDLEVIGRFSVGYVAGQTVRYDPFWGILTATEIRSGGAQ